MKIISITVRQRCLIPGLIYKSSLIFKPVSRPEDPPYGGEAKSQKHHGHAQADDDVDISDTIKTPSEPADQINHRVEQRDLLPEWRQHVDLIKTAAQERQRGG